VLNLTEYGLDDLLSEPIAAALSGALELGRLPTAATGA
jgi:hypothetical protein